MLICPRRFACPVARSTLARIGSRARIAAMFDADDAPDPDLAYANYLKTCTMRNVEPVPRDRALGLIQEWTETIAACRAVPPTTH